jgi:uncharacterized membrane protein YfcA
MFGIPLQDLIWLVALMAAAGAATGILAGVFGVGGGAIIVPALYETFRLMGVPADVIMPLCVGTSLAVIVPTSIRSFQTHRAKGAADMGLVKLWAVPCFLGVALGSYVASFAPAPVFKIVFICVASLIATKLLFGGDRWRVADTMPGRGLTALYGGVIGLLSSLMGIAGGAMATMVMTVHGRPIHQAIATASGIGIVVAVAGALGYMLAGWSKMAVLPPLSVGFVSFIGVALIAPMSTLLAPTGARLAHRLPKRTLEIAFGLFMLLVSARFLFDLIRAA